MNDENENSEKGGVFLVSVFFVNAEYYYILDISSYYVLCVPEYCITYKYKY